MIGNPRGEPVSGAEEEDVRQTVEAFSRRSPGRAGAIAVLMITLGACVPQEPPRVTAEALPASAVAMLPQAADAMQAPAASGSSGERPAAAAQSRGAFAAPATTTALAAPSAPAQNPPPVPPPGLNVDPRQLISLTTREVRIKLGDPTFRRVDRPSLIWQYRGRACILDVFLYRDGTDYRVTQVAVRSNTLARHEARTLRVSGDACFFGLLRARSPHLPS